MLAPYDVARVEAELARDPSLAAELDILRGVDGALSTLDGHDAPADFVERVLATARRDRKRGLMVRIGLPLAAAAALALVVFLPRSDRNGPGPDRTVDDEQFTYVWEADAETFGSLSLGELEDDILEGLDAA